MESIQSLLNIKNFKVEASHLTERGEIIREFILILNNARLESGYKPLSKKRLAFILSHIPTSDLRGFFNDCKHANNFSKYFWWALKPQNKAN